MEDKPGDLSVSVSDSVKTAEAFGKLEKEFHKVGIAGTLQCTKQEDLQKVFNSAWGLSKGTKKAVVVVVRGYDS